MPEAYTHIRTARAAAELAQIEPADPVAFAAGANGPDMFFCYRCWLPGARRGQDLPALGSRMHNDNTGAFLMSLLKNARTKAQRSYALGFLTHYAADTTVHPYINAVSGPGGVYDRPGGHGYFEIAIDSWLHKKDTGDGAVYAKDSCPRLLGAALAEVGVLLEKALQEAYGLTITREALADTFHHTYYWRSCFVSRWRLKYAFFWLVEPLFGGRGRITGHMTPAHLKGTGRRDKQKLPSTWNHPVTGEEINGGILELLDRSQRRGAAYMMAAQGFWKGKVKDYQLKVLLGSKSYNTGLEDDCSLGLAPAAEEPAPAEELQMV